VLFFCTAIDDRRSPAPGVALRAELGGGGGPASRGGAPGSAGARRSCNGWHRAPLEGAVRNRLACLQCVQPRHRPIWRAGAGRWLGVVLLRR